MDRTQIKHIFVAVALGSLGLLASGAQAGWEHRAGHDDAHGYDYAYGSPAPRAYEQNRMFGERIDARQQRQMERIHAGLRSGDLTRFEFRELMHEQREIRAMERHFRADGVIDAREFQHLDRALDAAGRNIRFERHDRQAYLDAPSRPWYDRY